MTAVILREAMAEYTQNEIGEAMAEYKQREGDSESQDGEEGGYLFDETPMLNPTGDDGVTSSFHRTRRRSLAKRPRKTAPKISACKIRVSIKIHKI